MPVGKSISRVPRLVSKYKVPEYLPFNKGIDVCTLEEEFSAAAELDDTLFAVKLEDTLLAAELDDTSLMDETDDKAIEEGGGELVGSLLPLPPPPPHPGSELTRAKQNVITANPPSEKFLGHMVSNSKR